MVDTKKVADRRTLRFESLEEAINEAAALVAADSDSQVVLLGNWTLGQALSHLAFWAEAPLDGYPAGVTPPWWMRLVLKMLKGRMLKGGMPAGVRIPGVEGGTLGADDDPPTEALERLRAAFSRLDRECPDCLNPLFGRMTHDEWRALNQRHAELHLSFFRPS